MNYLRTSDKEGPLEALERVVDELGGVRREDGRLVAACHETDEFEVMVTGCGRGAAAITVAEARARSLKDDALLDELEQLVERLGGLRCRNGHLLMARHETPKFEVLVRRHGFPTDATHQQEALMGTPPHHGFRATPAPGANGGAA